MPNPFYRFRPAEKLLGKYQELENQEIYFASGPELNDPLEGLLDIYWEGDAIAWNNLIKHYLMCLQHICSFLMIAGEEHPILDESIPVFWSRSKLPTDAYRKTYDEICNIFFSNPEVSEYVKKLSERSTPVRRTELLFHLSCLHIPAVYAIHSGFSKRGLTKTPIPQLSDVQLRKPFDTEMFGALEKLLDENNRNDDLINELFNVHNGISMQMDLIRRYGKTIPSEEKNRAFVFYEFPERYLARLEDLVHPKWYTACFMSSCTNSSVWGHYGNSHSGVCMIFEAEDAEEGPILKLEGINGFGSSGPTRGIIRHKFYSIDYTSSPATINFFRSLGTLSIPVVNEAWYYDEAGNMSCCAHHLQKEEDAWRNKYWEDFYKKITVKSVDWKYENEHRLVLNSMFSDLSERKDRKLKYDFGSLKGIIFGIKTTIEDKLKIMEVIDRKCTEKNRTDFKFYQAFYSPKKNCIDHHELGLLKIEPRSS